MPIIPQSAPELPGKHSRALSLMLSHWSFTCDPLKKGNKLRKSPPPPPIKAGRSNFLKTQCCQAAFLDHKGNCSGFRFLVFFLIYQEFTRTEMEGAQVLREEENPICALRFVIKLQLCFQESVALRTAHLISQTMKTFRQSNCLTQNTQEAN